MRKQKRWQLLSVVLLLVMALCGCRSVPAAAPASEAPQETALKISCSAKTLEIGETFQLEAKLSPDSGETIRFRSADETVATVDGSGRITAVGPGTVQIAAEASGLTAGCTITVKEAPKAEAPEAINGFLPFVPGGLLGGEGGEYIPVIMTPSGDKAVTFSGKGGLSWPDTANLKIPSAMGGYYAQELALDGLCFTWRLDKPMEFGGDHWYVIALEDRCQLFNSWNGEDPTKTLFLMIAIEDGQIALQPHYRDVIELGESWSYLGKSQGVAYTDGDTITVAFHKVPGGYEISLNGEVQVFDNIKSSLITITSELFPNDRVWLMAAAHIGNPEVQFDGEYAFTLGLGEEVAETEETLDPNNASPEGAAIPGQTGGNANPSTNPDDKPNDEPNDEPIDEPNDEPIDEPDTPDSSVVNGFKPFPTGGLVNHTQYDANITLNDCGSNDRVLVTGRGGTNYGDATNPRSTMGVYSAEKLPVDGLEIVYSVENWIQGGDHWYAFALSGETPADDQPVEWFENDGTDKALFFMFSYDNGKVYLQPHHIGNGSGWSYLGRSQGVEAAGGQYTISLNKTEDGYEVYMKNSLQETAERMVFDGNATIDAQIIDGLFPEGDARLMAGAYVDSYEGEWSFVIGS